MRRLSVDEARNVRALTLRVRPARSGERIEELSRHLPYGALNPDWFRVLNDMPAGAQPSINQMLKVIIA